MKAKPFVLGRKVMAKFTKVEGVDVKVIEAALNRSAAKVRAEGPSDGRFHGDKINRTRLQTDQRRKTNEDSSLS